MSHPASPIGPYVTVSIGVSAARPSAETLPQALIAAADRALYAAKGEGRDCVAPASVAE
jgi:PleD family two-component response regulator